MLLIINNNKTASAIMSHHANLSIEYDPMLRERDFGKLSRQPLKYLTSESTKQHIAVDEFIAKHDGESEKVFRSRIVKAYKTLINDAQKKQYQSVLVVTHGGPLKYLSSYWLENEFKLVEGLDVAPVAQGNTAVTRIVIGEDVNLIEEFNSTSHLKNQSSNQPPPPAV
jgi:broad specificity phosphatase PhoE